MLGQRVKSARFSGQLFYSIREFYLQQALLALQKFRPKMKTSVEWQIKTNLNGDIKTIDYEVNSDIDRATLHMMAMVQLAAAVSPKYSFQHFFCKIFSNR